MVDKINWEKVGLGTRTDKKIAKDLGVSEAIVYNKRKKLKILSLRKQIKQKIDWDKIPLGKKSDNKISKEFGISIHIIIRERR